MCRKGDSNPHCMIPLDSDSWGIRCFKQNIALRRTIVTTLVLTLHKLQKKDIRPLHRII